METLTVNLLGYWILETLIKTVVCSVIEESIAE